ncbi:MAG: chromosome partitioning protein ParB [Gemmatimonadota bacterium]
MAAARKKKKVAEAQSRGLDARRLGSGAPPAAVERLAAAIENDGGSTLAVYRDPLGSNWQMLAALPIDSVVPTPYQRDISQAHVERLTRAIDTLDRFLDPIIAIRVETDGTGAYWTPNGHHRLGAMRTLGAKSIVAIVVPEETVAHRILLLNTEKAHNLRERALEVARLAQGLAAIEDRPEREFSVEFEEAPLITLGLCYQENGRFSGGVYHPVLKRCDRFLASRLPKALETRRERATLLLELNESVNAAVAALKERGLESPYLKAFVVARINPLRFQRGRAVADYDETLQKMLASARRFDAGRIRPDQIARSGGAPDESAG